MTVELPLWLVIVFVVMFVLITIYLGISDLLAKVIWKAFKEKEENEIH